MPHETAAALAREILDAYAAPHAIDTPPSGRPGGLSLDEAYAVEAEVVSLRAQAGHAPVGVKVGYASKAVWRALKLETVVWAHMYDDTVEHTTGGTTTLDVSGMYAPKIEPEIVFKLRKPIEGGSDAAAILASVDWLALGFEIIDCVFPDWKLQPVDFVASRGLHTRLIVGTPMTVTPENIPALADVLPSFGVTLLRDSQTVAEGSGRNCLRSPALCLGELASAMAARGVPPLDAGALISSGTLTESQLLGADQTWAATVTGLDLPTLTVQTVRG
ncbi:MAG: fumarylacetoacetate hydrolase family protein [Vicinamibacterales bacterium]